MQHFGAVDEALATVGNESLLSLAPPAEQLRPFACSAEVEASAAGLDDRAVHQADELRRHGVVGGGAHHHFVEAVQALIETTECDERLAESVTGDDMQIGVVRKSIPRRGSARTARRLLRACR